MAFTENATTVQSEAQYAEKIQRHLKSRGIVTPDNYASKLILAHRKFRGTPFYIRIQLVDSVLQACEYWREYVEDWDSFVCDEVLSMVELHTTVVCLYFLRKKGIPLKKEPSLSRETIVAYTGTIKFWD